jgi:hypothetical protein
LVTVTAACGASAVAKVDDTWSASFGADEVALAVRDAGVAVSPAGAVRLMTMVSPLPEVGFRSPGAAAPGPHVTVEADAVHTNVLVLPAVDVKPAYVMPVGMLTVTTPACTTWLTPRRTVYDALPAPVPGTTEVGPVSWIANGWTIVAVAVCAARGTVGGWPGYGGVSVESPVSCAVVVTVCGTAEAGTTHWKVHVVGGSVAETTPARFPPDAGVSHLKAVNGGPPDPTHPAGVAATARGTPPIAGGVTVTTTPAASDNEVSADPRETIWVMSLPTNTVCVDGARPTEGRASGTMSSAGTVWVAPLGVIEPPAGAAVVTGESVADQLEGPASSKAALTKMGKTTVAVVVAPAVAIAPPAQLSVVPVGPESNVMPLHVGGVVQPVNVGWSTKVDFGIPIEKATPEMLVPVPVGPTTTLTLSVKASLVIDVSLGTSGVAGAIVAGLMGCSENDAESPAMAAPAGPATRPTPVNAAAPHIADATPVRTSLPAALMTRSLT